MQTKNFTFKKFIHWLIILVLLGGVIVVGWAGVHYVNQRFSPDPIPDSDATQNTQAVEGSTTTQPSKPSDGLPKSILLKVPFTPQAPTANWDELHNEACEEASALMADAYFKGMKDATLDPKYVETEIAKLTQWQKDHYGYYLDITDEEAARMIEDVYGLKTQIIHNFTEKDIKQALVDGKVIIMSANGRLLGNPNFRQPGPIHHMFIIKGYTSTNMITNDPGTRRGLNYAYTYSTLYKASADWVHGTQTTDTSIKNIIVVSKK